MPRRPIVGGNWKCNPDKFAKLDELLGHINACDTANCDVYMCPSPLHVAYCVDKVTNGAKVTPQNVNFKGCGAFTGEMAVEQMQDMGLTNVLIGHSERRGEFGIKALDDNATLAAKLKYALGAGMTVVFCIGEPKPIREQGLDAVLAEMDVQLTQIYSLLDPAKVVIAYEPVWAIGTGLTATPEDAQATHAGIRKLIADKASAEVAENIRIQYGGSANAANAGALSAQPDVDGFLVGGASMKPEFKDIVAAISQAKAGGAATAASTNPLKIGANVPDFDLKTTKGDFSFHSFLTGDAEKPWTLFFSHPNDFTPVCTTELGVCHASMEMFGQLGAKLIGLSCNTTDSHHAWSKDVLANMGDTAADSLGFPIIADADRKIVSTLGMLDPEEVTAEGIPLPARALVILHGTTVKLTILYPATTGRNFDEVKRILTSLQLTASNGLATPVDWKYGDRLIVGPPVKSEDAKAKFEDFNIEALPSGKEYLRSVKCLELTPDMSKTPAAVNAAAPPPGPNPLKIGATLPNFPVKTTKGDFDLHAWLTGEADKPWSIFFTHPKDFTPVCTTELGACHKLAGTAARLGCKLIGLSCDETESHHAWSKDVLARLGSEDDSLSFPIIADSDRSIVTSMGMLDPAEKDGAGVPLPARALLILHGTTVKLTILYPATTGRNFDEVIRTLVSLQLTAGQGLATPVDWKYGERVIVGPPVKTEDAKEKFKDFEQRELPSGKAYLRSVACPEAGLTAP